MFKTKRPLIVAFTLILLIGGFVAFKLIQLNALPESPKSAGFPVETVNVSLQSIAQGLSYIGTTESYEIVKLSSKISSRIIAIYGEEGSTVSSGDLIITLDNEDIKGKITSMGGKVEDASINLDYWNSQLEIYETLYNEGAISLQEYKKINLNRDSARSGYSQATSALQEAKISLKNTEIYSPISGTIIHEYSSVGDMSVPGKEIITIADTSQLKVTVKIFEGDLTKIKVGDSVTISTNEGKNSYSTKVTAILPVIDQAARTGSVEIAIPVEMLQTQNIKIGMSIDVFFIAEANENALVVPLSTVLTDADQPYLYVVKGNKAKKQIVKTGIENDKYIQITEGLKVGDQVISSGLSEIFDGRELYLTGGME